MCRRHRPLAQGDGQSLPQTLGTMTAPRAEATAGRPVSSRAQQCVLAVRSEPLRSQARQGVHLDGGRPWPSLLMLYSVVDDRSGVAIQEYHGVYGEDANPARPPLHKCIIKPTGSGQAKSPLAATIFALR